jgi:Domain of unknown function (DUF397)
VATTGGAVGVRDTQHRAGALLMFSPQAWERFAGSLKG